jgi:hypothetical protein
MPPRHRLRAGGVLTAIMVVGATVAVIAVAGCGAAPGGQVGAGAVVPKHPAGRQTSSGLPVGWGTLRLASGAVLPYPSNWQRVRGDRGTASAAMFNADGTIRAYLNATPADRDETLNGWTRFRLHHNADEGDRNVRLITARSGVRLAAGRASCVVDDYATSRSRYRELACIVAPPNGRQATVLVAAAQPNAWAREHPQLDFAIDHFIG